MLDEVSQFRDAIRVAGLDPPDAIEPGRFHRFPGVGKRNGNTAGWCILFDDRQGGCFGDWSTGVLETWQASLRKPLSDRARVALRRRVADARSRAEAERNARYAAAQIRASRIWNAAPAAADDHPYLICKGVKANGARRHMGRLLLPVHNFAGDLTSLQFIDTDGSKLLLTGGCKRGCFIPVTDFAGDSALVIVCEGWATGCTLAASKPGAVVLSAIDAGNLEPVAVAARNRWPSAKLVVAGDDDRLTAGNPGATKARAAAIAANASLALPSWPDDAPEELTDFNDLAIWLERRSA